MRFISLIIKNPFRNKTRSFLSIVGIAIGIATIVALGLITTGMEQSVQTTMNEGAAEITVTNITSIGAGTIDSSLVDELKNITNVSRTAGILSATDQNFVDMASSNDMSSMESSTRLYGINRADLDLEGIKDINGSFFEEGTKQAIIGKQYAQMNNMSIGDNISALGEEFEIVGIFETGGVLADSGVYVSLETLDEVTGAEGKVNQVIVKTDEGVNDTVVADAIEDKYENLTTITSEEMSQMLDNVIGILDAVSVAVSALAIIVGAIGIVNTMVMSVYERTKEIGVLKSVGWKSRKILKMIIGETLVLTILSGIVGSAFGILIAEVGVRLMGDTDFALGYSPSTFIMAFGITIVVGLIGGIYPAYKASKLAPTEALRYE